MFLFHLLLETKDFYLGKILEIVVDMYALASFFVGLLVPFCFSAIIRK
jgi:hypothetical protein